MCGLLRICWKVLQRMEVDADSTIMGKEGKGQKEEDQGRLWKRRRAIRAAMPRGKP